MNDTQHTNIILVGFMGTGKTAVGRTLARRLGMTFVDMDRVIQDREGMAVSRIFAEKGEPHFRSAERALVKELSAMKNRVIATGGGIVLDPDNIGDFSRTGCVVCLTAAPEAILKRVGHNSTRPLLAGGDKMEKIRALLEKRKPLYDAIPLQVDTSGMDVRQVADKVEALCARTHEQRDGTA